MLGEYATQKNKKSKNSINNTHWFTEPEILFCAMISFT